MGDKGRYRKVTTARKGVFGGKVIETRWVPDGSGCATIVVILFLLFVWFRGC
jgi:hypothetical protein